MPRTSVPRNLALVIASALVVLAIVLAGGLATARAQTASVEITPETGAEPGQLIIVSGFGFQDGETVSVDFGGTTIATVVVNGGGAFQLGAGVPVDIPPGTHPMEVTGDLGSAVTLEYEVLESSATPAPTPTAAPTAAPPGAPEVRVLPEGATPGDFITVTGSGFGGGQSITVSFDGADLATVGTTIAGAFLANVVIPPAAAPGVYSIEARGTSGTAVSVNYTVVAAPTPTPTPTAAPTSEPTVTPTPTASPTATPPSPTATPAPGGPSDGAGGDGSTISSDFPIAIVTVLAAAGALIAVLYLFWVRRTFA